MFIKNHSEPSLDKAKSVKKKLLILSKVNENDFSEIRQKTNLLFNDPSTFLKTSSELNFDFIIGKRAHTNKEIVKRKKNRNPTSNFINILAKRMTRARSITSGSFDIKKSFDFSKKNILNINEEKKNLIKKNSQKISNIFSNYRKIISKNRNNTEQNIDFSDKIPNFLKTVIKTNLNKQEKALRYKEKYNQIFSNLEESISKAITRDMKNNKKNSELQFYQTANLFKNSINNYRKKLENLKLKGKNKKKNLILNNHIRNWEMSLRNPKNFSGLRKGYLNISSDKRPIWIMVTEKSAMEEEKIINPNINDFNPPSLLKQKFMKTQNKTFYSGMRNKMINLERFNGLQIKGKNLIDLEEKQAKGYHGNIKILDIKYDKDSTKDLLFKMNCTINKYSFDEKLF